MALSKNIAKDFSRKSGKSTKEIEKQYKKAVDISKSMGKGKDDTYIVEVLKSLIGIEESFNKDVIKLYLDENFDKFDDFLEAIETGAITVSSDISQELRPEKKKKTVKLPPPEDEEDEEDEEKEEKHHRKKDKK